MKEKSSRSRRGCIGQRGKKARKGANKNKVVAKEMTKRRLLAQREEIDAKLAAMDDDGEAPEPEEVEHASVSEAENRVVVKFFWRQLGSPTDPEEWKDRNGVISVIRRRMGADAPAPRTVKRTLLRLVADEDDDLSSRKAPGAKNGGPRRHFSEEDDLYVGLIICEGHSQRSATFLINGERRAQGLGPISRQMIEDSEKRIELIRRRRRKKKSGSSDLESAWCKASLAFTLEKQAGLLVHHTGAAKVVTSFRPTR